MISNIKKWTLLALTITLMNFFSLESAYRSDRKVPSAIDLQLFTAVENNDLPSIQVALTAGANPNSEYDMGNSSQFGQVVEYGTALLYYIKKASPRFNLNIVQALVTPGTDATSSLQYIIDNLKYINDPLKAIPTAVALELGRVLQPIPPTVGSEQEATTYIPDVVLFKAVKENNLDDIARALHYGARADSWHTIGTAFGGEPIYGTPLFYYIDNIPRNLNLDVIKTLLEAGADPMIKQKYGQTVFDLLTRYQESAGWPLEAHKTRPSLETLDVLNRLLRTPVPGRAQPPLPSLGSQHEASTFFADKALFDAVKKGDPVQVVQAIHFGARANSWHVIGTTEGHPAFGGGEYIYGTPLFYYIQKNSNTTANPEIIRALLQAGADPRLGSSDSPRESAINLAIINQYPLEIRRLLYRTKPAAATGFVEGPAAAATPEVAPAPMQEAAAAPTEEEVCSLCLGEFNNRRVLHKSGKEEAEHAFCQECLRGWMKSTHESAQTCPICRDLFTKEQIDTALATVPAPQQQAAPAAAIAPAQPVVPTVAMAPVESARGLQPVPAPLHRRPEAAFAAAPQYPVARPAAAAAINDDDDVFAQAIALSLQTLTEEERQLQDALRRSLDDGQRQPEATLPQPTAPTRRGYRRLEATLEQPAAPARRYRRPVQGVPDPEHPMCALCQWPIDNPEHLFIHQTNAPHSVHKNCVMHSFDNGGDFHPRPYCSSCRKDFSEEEIRDLYRGSYGVPSFVERQIKKFQEAAKLQEDQDELRKDFLRSQREQ